MLLLSLLNYINTMFFFQMCAHNDLKLVSWLGFFFIILIQILHTACYFLYCFHALGVGGLCSNVVASCMLVYVLVLCGINAVCFTAGCCPMHLRRFQFTNVYFTFLVLSVK